MGIPLDELLAGQSLCSSSSKAPDTDPYGYELAMVAIFATPKGDNVMKTLFVALRAAVFGTGFVLLWGWVALGLHRRYDDTLGFACPNGRMRSA